MAQLILIMVIVAGIAFSVGYMLAKKHCEILVIHSDLTVHEKARVIANFRGKPAAWVLKELQDK